MKTLIIVDDSGTFKRIMESILKKHFNIIGKGSSGIEGFELYKTLKPDLVLMDITMPNCDGKECLQNIIKSYPDASVIMVSGIGDDQTVKECLALGAKAFVCKSEISTTNPDDSVLIKTLNKVLNSLPTERWEAA